MEIGYDLKTKEPALTEYFCLICQFLLRNAIELPCSHVYCNDCLIRWEEKKLSENIDVDLTCTLCRKPYKRDEKQKSSAFDRVITTCLDVLCNHHGCPWIGKIIDFPQHSKVCEFAEETCSCRELVSRKDRSLHEAECSHRLSKCELCGLEQEFRFLEEHKRNQCPEREVSCPNTECQIRMKKSTVLAHLSSECLFQDVACMFHHVGCDVTIKRGELESHSLTFNNKHTELLLLQHTNTLKELEQVRRELNESRNILQTLEQKFNGYEVENQMLKNKIDHLANESSVHTKNSKMSLNLIDKSTDILARSISTMRDDISRSIELGTPEGKPFSTILTMIDQLDRESYEAKFPRVPLVNIRCIIFDEAKYNFKELANVQQKYLSQQLFPYKDRMNHLLELMQIGHVYQINEDFYCTFRLPEEKKFFVTFHKDIEYLHCNHAGVLHFGNNRICLINTVDNYQLYMKIEGCSTQDSFACLCNVNREQQLLLKYGIFNEVCWENYKTRSNDILLHIKKSSKT